MDVLGPVMTKSIGLRSYALCVIDDNTAYSSIFFLYLKSQVYESFREYMSRSERRTGFKLQYICLGGAGEDKGDIVSVLKRVEDVTLESSPPYASKSNGRAERLLQELSLRA